MWVSEKNLQIRNEFKSYLSPTTPQSLPHAYPPPPAYQLGSADILDPNDYP